MRRHVEHVTQSRRETRRGTMIHDQFSLPPSKRVAVYSIITTIRFRCLLLATHVSRALVDVDRRNLAMQMDISWIKGRKANRTRAVHLLFLVAGMNSPFLYIFTDRESIGELSVCPPFMPLAAARRELFLDILGRITAVPREARASRSRLLLSLLNARVAGKLFNYFMPRCFSVSASVFRLCTVKLAKIITEVSRYFNYNYGNRKDRLS